MEMKQSFVHFYDRSIVSCGLSKSFAHPGLRIGWLVASPDVIKTFGREKIIRLSVLL